MQRCYLLVARFIALLGLGARVAAGRLLDTHIEANDRGDPFADARCRKSCLPIELELCAWHRWRRRERAGKLQVDCAMLPDFATGLLACLCDDYTSGG
jgi:hypothetical protein